jgi:alanine racemase
MNMQISRRELIQSGAALTVASWSGFSQSAKGSALNSSFDPWIEIHRDNLLHNVTQVQHRVGSRPILAVVKINAYGMGLVNAGRLLSPVPAISGFAVVKLQEAVTLRDAGIRKPILLMGSCTERGMEEAFARNITPIVYTPIGATLERIARRRQRPVRIHIFVDTGLGREGVPHHQAAALCRDLAGRKAVRIEGIMTAFNEVNDFEKEQFRRFQSLCTALEAEGIHLGTKHVASTTALFRHPESFLDMVRPGAAIYGVHNWLEQRDSQVMDLRTALSLKARVIYVKQLREGDSAGYEASYVAKKKVWVATLPFGYVDGVPTEASKGARVRIGKDSYPVVAFSSSHTIVEIGEEPRVQIGDTAVLFDWQTGSQPEDLERACGVFAIRVLLRLNPLLPRQIV